MVDGGETDTKLIAVIDCDPRWKGIEDLKDLSQHELAEIKEFFETYKNLQKKKVSTKDFKDCEWAIKEYEECVELMKEYGKLPKEEFLAKMHKEHPEKYEG
jgi:inorganic pyrophosphatase